MQKPASISDATWTRLKEHAIPLEDTLDTVLDRLITRTQGHSDCPASPCITLTQADRIHPDNLTQQPPDNTDPPTQQPTVQDDPTVWNNVHTPHTVRDMSAIILRYTQSQGGTALEADIHRHITQDLDPPLNPADLHLHKDKEARWRKNARTARYQLVKAGLLAPAQVPGSFRISPHALEHLRHIDSYHRDLDTAYFRASFYHTLILESLVQNGGTAKAAQIIRRIEARVAPLFTPADLQQVRKKGSRWRAHINDASRSLRRQGYLIATRRGTWEITPQGRQSLGPNGSPVPLEDQPNPAPQDASAGD